MRSIDGLNWFECVCGLRTRRGTAATSIIHFCPGPGNWPKETPPLQDADAKMRSSEATRTANGGKAQLGDAVESFLASHGVTPERYVAFKAKFGLPPTCGCADRKRWLNRLGEHFGINDKLSEFLKRRTRKE